MGLKIESFFDADSNTFSYVIADEVEGVCAIIDPVLDFDYAAGRTRTDSADELVEFIKASGWQLQWVLETHVHADHLSAAAYLKQRLGGRIGIGEQVTRVQQVFAEAFNEGDGFVPDGGQFDSLFKDGEQIELGNVVGEVMYTPGHTPACVSYRFGDAVFVGDTLFMPDYGTARCDFPGGDAGQLYQSIQRILSLPDETRLFMCHDYKAPGRDSFACVTTVAEQRVASVHVNESVAQAEFVAMRTERDATLAMPKLLLPSVQVNMRAGQLPAPEENGRAYLKIPLNLF